MRDWLVEIIDQMALGEFLAKSSISCGERFGLIAEDNAVESMLIAYVELHKELVGGHKPGGITKRDWDQTKREFPRLLQFVVGQEPNLQLFEKKIGEYHLFRDNLYHSGIPITTSADRVTKHSKLARQVMHVLFGIQFTPNEWDEILARTAESLATNPRTHVIRRQVTYQQNQGLVIFTTSALPTAREAILLCLQGYSNLTASPPSRPNLTKSLAMSGHPLAQSVIDVRLTELRKEKWVQQKQLTLSSKGRKELAKKYLVTSTTSTP